MADNLSVTQGSGTLVAANEIAGVKYQRVKLSVGPAGSATDADTGVGTGGLATLRTVIDSSQVAPMGTNYLMIAASQTNIVLAGSAGGAVGDYLSALLVIPGSVNAGSVTLTDGASTVGVVFTGGFNSLSNLVPFLLPLGIISINGAWRVSTGASVTVLASGTFA